MRLIDADALMREVEKAEKSMERHGREFSCSFLSSSQEISTEWYFVEQLIDDAPTIEAEPIVRCKDCKHWHDPDENKWGDCYEWGGYSQENDYCSWGERREG